MKRTRVMKWVLLVGSVVLPLAWFVKKSKGKTSESILNEPSDTAFIQAADLSASGAT